MGLKLALIGDGIKHSKSPQIYKDIYSGQVEYDLIDIPLGHKLPHIKDLMKSYNGISITTPYKESFLSQVKASERAKTIKAVNCIYLDSNLFMNGENTDFLALEDIIKSRMSYFESAIILGSGVMARICIDICKLQKVGYEVIARKIHGDISNINLEKFENSLIINCCSRSFIFMGKIHSSSMFYDLNYAQVEQQRLSERLGYEYVDGEELLMKQAKYALDLFLISKAKY